MKRQPISLGSGNTLTRAQLEATATPDIRTAAYAWEYFRGVGLSEEIERRIRAESLAGHLTDETAARARAEVPPIPKPQVLGGHDGKERS